MTHPTPPTRASTGAASGLNAIERPVVVNVRHAAPDTYCYVGRAVPGMFKASLFGNPFKIGMGRAKALAILRVASGQAELPLAVGALVPDRIVRGGAVELYRIWINMQPWLCSEARRLLQGKNLGCWCAPDACHADALLEIANAPLCGLNVIDIRPTRIVPCGTCNTCCRNDAIFIHPECGDDASQYQTVEYEGRTILDHKANGDCIYLDRAKGCTIHERRPTVCREMDCRELVDRVGGSRLTKAGMGALVYAARRLQKNGIGSCAEGLIAASGSEAQ